jgi:hypothetical protein
VADDEVVCADCGMSLAAAQGSAESSAGLMDELGFAEERDSWTIEVRTWRVAAFAGVACLLITATAILLLQQDGSRKPTVGLPAPTTVTGAPDEFPGPSSFAVWPTTSAIPSVSPSHRATSTKSRTRSASPSSTGPAASTSAAPTSSGPRTSPAPTTSSSSVVRSVHLSKGALDVRCGRHCYHLVVSLSGFPSAAHQVTCWSSARGGRSFGSYTTTSVVSTNCAYTSNGSAAVWVVVDSTYRSNTVAW